MTYSEAQEIHKIISEQFFFNRKKQEVLAGDFEEDPEAEELVYDIFADVIATTIILATEEDYAIELYSKVSDLYLTPILEYFKLEDGQIVSRHSDPIALQSRKRPLEIGSSIGPLNEAWRGTLGCVVQALEDAQYYVLSNHHVLYSETGYEDEFIVQPSNPDGGTENDAIGLYKRSLAPDFTDINDYDAAIAGPISLDFTHLIQNVNIEQTTEAVIGMKVYKIGATTGKTFGVVSSVVSSIKVSISDNSILEFQNQIDIKGTTEDFITPSNFSRPGDSGAIIIDYETHKVVGLLFCGNGRYSSFANKINPVLSELNISL